MKSFETLDWNKNYKIKADISFSHTKVIPFHTQAIHVDVSAWWAGNSVLIGLVGGGFRGMSS